MPQNDVLLQLADLLDFLILFQDAFGRDFVGTLPLFFGFLLLAPCGLLIIHSFFLGVGVGRRWVWFATFRLGSIRLSGLSLLLFFFGFLGKEVVKLIVINL